MVVNFRGGTPAFPLHNPKLKTCDVFLNSEQIEEEISLLFAMMFFSSLSTYLSINNWPKVSFSNVQDLKMPQLGT